MTALDEISSATFAAALKTEMVLEGTDGRVLTLTVDAVTEKPAATPRGAKRTAFSVVLLGPSDYPHGGGDFTLVHPSFGRIGPVHVVRIHPGSIEPGCPSCFQVVFN